MKRLNYFSYICMITVLASSVSLLAEDGITFTSTSWLDGSIPLIIVAVLFLVFFIPARLRDKKRIVKKFRKTAADPDQVKLSSDQLIQLSLTPVEYNRLLGEHFSPINAFRLIFLELIRKNVISTDKYAVHIDKAKLNDLKLYENLFIEVLLNNMSFTDSGQRKSIQLVTFASELTDHMNQIASEMERLNEQLKVSMDILKQTLKEDKKYKEVKKAAYILKAYFQQHDAFNFINTYDILQHYQHNHSIDLMALYALASETPYTPIMTNTNQFSDAVKDVSDVDEFYDLIAHILDVSSALYINKSYTAHYRHSLVSGSTSGFGQSSASGRRSGSGCGGGGAD